ncbi:alpha/beta fold hydrolase [Pannus brasiliensis CCIBt3594]|uniref:Alpha/beta fold hydrolase n=1 Tax=Pannus brasiliensis CCIBt3594 TaxID=1427578 RepID=A0AAW9QXK2_9CHRO
MSAPIITPAILETLSWTWRGYNIPYTVMGEGQPLLLIHGFGASIGHWRKNIPVLAEKGYRVYALDLLGFGGSDKVKLTYSIDLWRQQIADFWREKIERPTVFVGNSIGGLITLNLMAENPEITAGGVIINCAGGLNHRPEELNPLFRFVMGAFNRLVTSPITGPFIFDRVRQKSRIRETLKQVYRDHTAITEELVEMLYQPSCDEGAREVFAAVIAAPPGPGPRELLQKIDRPLLVLWGEDDPWTPLAGSVIYQERAKSGNNTTFHSIPNAGHCPHDENPAKVNELIFQWLTTAL